MYNYDIRGVLRDLRKLFLRRDIPILLLLSFPLAAASTRSLRIGCIVVLMMLPAAAAVRVVQFYQLKSVAIWLGPSELEVSFPPWKDQHIRYSEISEITDIYTTLGSETAVIYWCSTKGNRRITLRSVHRMKRNHVERDSMAFGEITGQAKPSRHILDEIKLHLPDPTHTMRLVGKKREEAPPAASS